MGLRAQGLGWVLGLSLGLGGLGLTALTLHLQSSLDEIETSVLRADAQRLHAGLQDLLAQRRRTAQEWSQWSDMHAYMLRPQGSNFPASNLTPAAIGASGLAGLAVLTLAGEVVQPIRAPGEVQLDWATLLGADAALSKRLRSPPSAQGECGLAADQGRLMIVCHMPIVDSEARLPAAGSLITADWVTPERLQTLSQVLALRFELSLQGRRSGPGQGPGQEQGKGQGQKHGQEQGQAQPLVIPGWTVPAYLTVGTETHQVTWGLNDLVGSPVAQVQLAWPRELRVQTNLVLRGAQAVVLAVAVGLALAFLLLIDRRLVGRLTRLQRHLKNLREAEDWTARLPADARDELSELAQEGNHLLQRIDGLVRHLGELSNTDALTGLANRRAFDHAIAQAGSRSARAQQPLTLAVVDVDHFKRFNDAHGHAVGDQALKQLAEGLRSVARRGGDLAARLGGEEFVVLMEGADSAMGQACASRLQHWLRAQACGPGEPLPEPMTVSIGLATLAAGETPAALLERADQALYRAKANGRNRIET